MAVAVDTVYSGVSGESNVKFYSGKLRTRWESSYSANTQEWTITIFLQGKGLGVAQEWVGSFVPTLDYIKWDIIDAEAWIRGEIRDTDYFVDLLQYSFQRKETGRLSQETIGIGTVKAWSANVLNPIKYETQMETITVKYGDVDLSKPTLSLRQVPQTATYNSIELEYTISAPYPCSVRIYTSSSDIYNSTGVDTGTYQVIMDASPNRSYTVKAEAICENGMSIMATAHAQSRPVYVDSILSSPGDVEVNIGEEADIWPKLTPITATYHDVFFTRDSSGTYRITTTINPGRVVTIEGEKSGSGTVSIKAMDGNEGDVIPHTAATLSVPVTVYNPAKAFDLEESYRKIVAGNSYKILHRITANYESEPPTDTTVTYAISQSEQSLQGVSVSSDGTITTKAGKSGVCVIDVTLVRRVGGNLTKQFTCVVVAKREWVHADLPVLFLTHRTVEDAYNNIALVAEWLGEETGETIDVTGTTDTIEGNAIPPNKVQPILNEIETHIDTIWNVFKNLDEDVFGYWSDAASWYVYPAEDIEDAEPFRWVNVNGKITDPITQIERWFYFLDGVKNYLSPQETSTFVNTNETGDVTSVYIEDENGGDGHTVIIGEE